MPILIMEVLGKWDLGLVLLYNQRLFGEIVLTNL